MLRRCWGRGGDLCYRTTGVGHFFVGHGLWPVLLSQKCQAPARVAKLGREGSASWLLSERLGSPVCL